MRSMEAFLDRWAPVLSAAASLFALIAAFGNLHAGNVDAAIFWMLGAILLKSGK